MRRFWVPLLIILTVVLISAGVFVLLFLRGAGGVDNWAAQQVVRIGNTYLVPQMAFDRFEFQFPGTLTLRDVTLTSPDGTEVVAASAMRITFTETPRRGRPIHIENVEIIDAALQLIREETADGETGFKGLVPFVRTDLVRQQERVDEDIRLSNVLQIRKLQIQNASLIYQHKPAEPPMSLEGLNLDLDVVPSESPEERGWYRLDTAIERAPVFSLNLEGRFNIDTLVAELDIFDTDISLNEDARSALPVQLQTILEKYDARGSIVTRARGVFPARDWRSSKIRSETFLIGVNVAIGEGRLPIEEGRIVLDMADGVASLSRIDMSLLQGELRALAKIDLNAEGLPAELSWEVQGVELREALRAQAPPGEPPKLAGLVRSLGEASASLADPRASLTGRGEVLIADGRLLLIPLVSKLAEALNVIGRLRSSTGLTDNAEAEFTLTGEAVNLTSFALVTEVMAARGSGFIYFDKRLDLSVNAGPLERVQASLGVLGDVLGAITDRLVTYRVRGEVGNPQISVQPLGLGS